MKGNTDLTKEAFDQLLDWLDQDRGGAGRKYEEIRSRLIKIFVCRGCVAAEDLADETINRVAGKVVQIAGSYAGNPALYFYGVADKIYLEYLRRMPAPLPILCAGQTEETEVRCRCLEQCIERLSPENRKLILVYYGDHEQRTIDMRKHLARQLEIGANALWIRAHRIRMALRKCVCECLGEKIPRKTAETMRSSGPAEAIS
jgi:DNA-directed RNA polymerase specialized sigma24 family protein